jgi:protein TonB
VSTLRDNWNLPDGTTEEELTTQRSFFRGPGVRYASALVVIGLLFVAGAYWFFGGDGLPPPKPRQDTITIIIRPPPPPPPPPPEQKMIEQPKMAEQEFKEDKPDEKPPEPKPDNEANAKDEPPGPATLNAPVGPGGLLPQIRLGRKQQDAQGRAAGADPAMGRRHRTGQPGSADVVDRRRRA